MWKQATGLLLVCVLWSATPAFAQKVEIMGLFGWTLSDGVTTDTAVIAGDGNIYDAIDTKDSASWGFGAGFHVNERFEVGFLFNQQMSTLAVEGTNTRDIGDLNVQSYHPYFAFNFGEVGARLRPYLMIGMGATHFSGVDFVALGANRQIPGQTQFSTTWGAGVKAYPSPHFGVRLGAQWTPTYIKTDAEGWWCDPYWGCYLTGDPQYSNQFQISGGVTARF
jgi:opacity protein-like surface antigen